MGPGIHVPFNKCSHCYCQGEFRWIDAQLTTTSCWSDIVYGQMLWLPLSFSFLLRAGFLTKQIGWIQEAKRRVHSPFTAQTTWKSPSLQSEAGISWNDRHTEISRAWSVRPQIDHTTLALLFPVQKEMRGDRQSEWLTRVFLLAWNSGSERWKQTLEWVSQRPGQIHSYADHARLGGEQGEKAQLGYVCPWTPKEQGTCTIRGPEFHSGEAKGLWWRKSGPKLQDS